MKPQVPIHIMRVAPADYVNDLFVRRCYQKRDYVTAAFYPLFLFWSHMEGGSLPADPDDLSTLFLMPARDIKAALAVCIAAGKVREEEGRLYNKRVLSDVQKELEFRRNQAELGRKGAQARIDKVAQGKPKATPEGTLSPRGLSPPAPSPAPAPTPVPAPAPPPSPDPSPDPAPGARPLQPEPRWPDWLAPYGEAWTARFGKGSTPPWGEMNQALHRLHGEHGEAEVLARWKRFLGDKPQSQYARPGRFVEGFDEWGSQSTALASIPAGDGVARPTGRKPTAAEISAQTMRDALEREKGGR